MKNCFDGRKEEKIVEECSAYAFCIHRLQRAMSPHMATIKTNIICLLPAVLAPEIYFYLNPNIKIASILADIFYAIFMLNIFFLIALQKSKKFNQRFCMILYK